MCYFPFPCVTLLLCQSNTWPQGWFGILLPLVLHVYHCFRFRSCLHKNCCVQPLRLWMPFRQVNNFLSKRLELNILTREYITTTYIILLNDILVIKIIFILIVYISPWAQWPIVTVIQYHCLLFTGWHGVTHYNCLSLHLESQDISESCVTTIEHKPFSKHRPFHSKVLIMQNLIT